MKNLQLKLKTPEATNQQNSRKSMAALDSSRGRNALRAKNGGGSKNTVDKTSSVGKTQMMRIPSTTQPANGASGQRPRRRENRIKSLYATTSNNQDLTLDLSKINNELNKNSGSN